MPEHLGPDAEGEAPAGPVDLLHLNTLVVGVDECLQPDQLLAHQPCPLLPPPPHLQLLLGRSHKTVREQLEEEQEDDGEHGEVARCYKQ